MRRSFFLVKVFAFDPIRVPLHRDRTIVQMGQQIGGNLDVVMDYLRFSKTSFRIENLVQVCEREPVSINLNCRFLCHAYSRTTSRGSLSVRKPRKTGCLSSPSCVHAVNWTWQTSFGSTQWQRRISAGVSAWPQRPFRFSGRLTNGQSSRVSD